MFWKSCSDKLTDGTLLICAANQHEYLDGRMPWKYVAMHRSCARRSQSMAHAYQAVSTTKAKSKPSIPRHPIFILATRQSKDERECAARYCIMH